MNKEKIINLSKIILKTAEMGIKSDLHKRRQNSSWHIAIDRKISSKSRKVDK